MNLAANEQRKTLSRRAHQPTEGIQSYEDPSPAELAAKMGDTVAVILAWDDATTPLQVTFEDPERKPVICDGSDGAEGKGTTAKPPAIPRPLQRYEGVELVAHAVRTACEAQVAGVYVLANVAFKPQVEAAVHATMKTLPADNAGAGTGAGAGAGAGADAKADAGVATGSSADANARADTSASANSATRADAGATLPPVTVLPYDRTTARIVNQAACNFELIGIPKAALDEGARALLLHPQASCALFMSCDQVRIRPRHLLALQQRLEEHPEADVVTSWITWLRRTPVLATRRFLEGLSASPLCRPRDASVPWRPLPHLKMQEVVFGEEKLAANATKPAAAERFGKEHTLSALEAVRLAREEQRLEGETSPTHATSSPKSAADKKRAAFDERIKTLNDADKLLVNLARKTIRRLDAHLSSNPALAQRTTWADAWGRRNKTDFPLFATREHRTSLVYLDSAATSQRLGTALEAQHAFDAYENANIYRGAYVLSTQATAMFNEARATVERFINADRRQTAFTANTSKACNLVAQAWGTHNVSAGDLIVVALSEHHSNQLPWLMLAQRKGARVAYIPLLDDGRLDQDAYDVLLEEKPKLVCLAQISNVLGLINPVQDMAKRAHAAGARVMVDAAQSIPHLAIDVKELGADFVAFSGHKLYGPMGIGCLWISPDAFSEMDPVASGGGAISHVSVDSYYLRQGAIQYEVGTPPVAQAVGLAQAVRYLDMLEMDDVFEHGAALTAYLMEGLRDLPFLTVWGDHASPEGQTGLVALSVAEAESAQVGTLLGSVGVDVRSGGHCALPLSASMGVTGTTRISFGVYNTREDVEAALCALRLVGRLFGVDRGDADSTDEESGDARTNENAKASESASENVGASAGGSAKADADENAHTPASDADDTSEHVRAHYAEVASQVLASMDEDAICGRSSCCDAPATRSEIAAQHSETSAPDKMTARSEAATLYAADVLSALPEGVRKASRGCGDPVAQANLQPGEIVLDLGSGGGIDALIAARLVGEGGQVYGVDMTDEMIELAKRNANAAQAANVKFLKGRIEDIPLPDASVDVVISNCVINLAADRRRVLREACRVLKPGGRLIVSDIVAFSPVPDELKGPLGRITGCTNGMLGARDYETQLRKVGFAHASIEPKTVYTLEVLHEKAQRKDRLDAFAALDGGPQADGTTGSAIIRAMKA